MADETRWEYFKAEGKNILDRIKGLIHEGSLRRVVGQHQRRTVAEFPLTAGRSAAFWHRCWRRWASCICAGARRLSSTTCSSRLPTRSRVGATITRRETVAWATFLAGVIRHRLGSKVHALHQALQQDRNSHFVGLCRPVAEDRMIATQLDRTVH